MLGVFMIVLICANCIISYLPIFHTMFVMLKIRIRKYHYLKYKEAWLAEEKIVKKARKAAIKARKAAIKAQKIAKEKEEKER